MTTGNKIVATPDKGTEAGLAGLEYYSLKDYKRLLLRRKWTILSVTLAVGLLASLADYFIPNSYKASTVVVVDPGKVPEFYVRSSSTISAAERLAMLQQQILSNTPLAQVIDELGLYSDRKNQETPDQIVAEMRKDTVVEPVTYTKDLQAFTISYISRSPATSARVANRLASLFIEQNMKAREQQVMGTAEFFDREVEKAKEDLDLKGKKMEALRSKYVAELPESQNAHVQALGSLQLEMRAEMDAINRDEQQKVYMQSLLADTPAVVDLDSSTSGNNASALEDELARRQNELDQLRTRYGRSYPDVLKKAHEVEALQQQISRAEKAVKGVPLAPPSAQRRNPVIDSQIAAIDQDIQKREEHERSIKSQIDFHQGALERAPAIAQQLESATRDYNNAQENYKALQDRKYAADVSSDVEIRQKGERFVILEPAQAPSRPYFPNRVLIDGLALAAGLVLSLVLVLALEILDPTLKTEREVIDRVRVPVVGEIPWLSTSRGQRREQLRVAFVAAGNMVLAIGYLALIAVAVR